MGILVRAMALSGDADRHGTPDFQRASAVWGGTPETAMPALRGSADDQGIDADSSSASAVRRLSTRVMLVALALLFTLGGAVPALVLLAVFLLGYAVRSPDRLLDALFVVAFCGLSLLAGR